MTVSVRASSQVVNSGGDWIRPTLPTGTMSGDLLVLSVESTSGAPIPSQEGWQRVALIPCGSRSGSILAKIAGPAEPSDWLLYSGDGVPGGDGFAAMSAAVVALADHDVTDVTTGITFGTPWARSGVSTGVVQSPGVTTTAPDDFALAFTFEASSTDGGFTVTADSGFTLVEHVPNTSGHIEDLTIWSKTQPVAGSTGDLVIDYGAVQHANNGAGVQAYLAALATAPPTINQIGAHGCFAFTTDSLTVGARYLAGGVHEVVTYLNAVEVDRQALDYNPVTSWGHVVVTGLTPGTAYDVEFEVDGVVQTDAYVSATTLTTVPTSFTVAAGSCQFEQYGHPIYAQIASDSPSFLAHMGDLHYRDAVTEPDWRGGCDASLYLIRETLREVPITWTPDNHDRVIVDTLNLGSTDPQTAAHWKHLAGTAGWASPGGLGRAWRQGRVLFVQTDHWSERDDPDLVAEPTFLGAAQKSWWKATLEGTNAEVIVWFSKWTAKDHSNGRWLSFPEETAELEAWLDARPDVKAKLVLVGGDSHQLQADSGDHLNVAGEYVFYGVPSLNASGFTRSIPGDDGSTGWDIVNRDNRLGAGTVEQDWGAYSRLTFTDNGDAEGITLRWEAVCVDVNGDVTIPATFERTYAATAVEPGSDSPVCGWEPSFVSCEGGTPSTLNSLDPEQRQSVIDMAVEYLWRWTGQTIGVCTYEVRPCLPKCSGARGTTYWGRGPFASPDGPIPLAWACGWCGQDTCDCLGGDAFLLPGPVHDVLSVTEDGENFTAWARVGDALVRTDGGVWERCQDVSASASGPDTLAVTYQRGVPVPVGGQIAAGLLAEEFAKGLCGDGSCALPQRVQSITRQGMTVAVLDAFEDIEDGHTGIWLIDSWVASVTRPLPRRSTVLTPENRSTVPRAAVPGARRVTPSP